MFSVEINAIYTLRLAIAAFFAGSALVARVGILERQNGHQREYCS